MVVVIMVTGRSYLSIPTAVTLKDSSALTIWGSEGAQHSGRNESRYYRKRYMLPSKYAV